MSSVPSPCERLAQSRERLRHILGQADPRSAPDGASGPPGSSTWLSGTNTNPESSLLMGLLQSWWRKQPLHVILTLAGQTATSALQPTAQRHPYRLVLGAAAVGGVLALVRPWRWLSSTAVLATLLPQILSEVSKHLPAQAPRAAKSGHDPAR